MSVDPVTCNGAVRSHGWPRSSTSSTTPADRGARARSARGGARAHREEAIAPTRPHAKFPHSRGRGREVSSAAEMLRRSSPSELLELELLATTVTARPRRGRTVLLSVDDLDVRWTTARDPRCLPARAARRDRCPGRSQRQRQDEHVAGDRGLDACGERPRRRRGRHRHALRAHRASRVRRPRGPRQPLAWRGPRRTSSPRRPH